MNVLKRQYQVSLKIPLDERMFRRLNLVCGPHRKVKRGAWVAEAIGEKLAREGRRRTA